MNETLKNYFLSKLLGKVRDPFPKTARYCTQHAPHLLAIAAVAIAALSGLMPAEAGLLPFMLLNTEGAGGGTGADTTNNPSASGDGKPVPASGGAGDPGKPAPAAEVTPKTELKSPQSKGSAAHERAAARLSKAAAAKATPASDASAQQPQPGEAPKLGPDGKPVVVDQAAQPAAAKPGEEKPPAGDAPNADSAKAPESWTADRKAKFEALPPEGRAVILDFHKEMSAGLTHAFTQLSEEKAQHQELFALDVKFKRGPDGAKEVIAELAKNANLEVFFERPVADDKIPEDVLADPVKHARYIEDRAVKRAQQSMQAESEKNAKETRTREAQATLTREFQDAATAHTDFTTHRPAVHQLLQKAPTLSVEEAYRLVTYDGLVKHVNEAQATRQKLATAVAELTALKKKATQLPAGGGAGAPTGEDKLLSPGERAFKRAGTKIAARGAPA